MSQNNLVFFVIVVLLAKRIPYKTKPFRSRWTSRHLWTGRSLRSRVQYPQHVMTVVEERDREMSLSEYTLEELPHALIFPVRHYGYLYYQDVLDSTRPDIFPDGTGTTAYHRLLQRLRVCARLRSEFCRFSLRLELTCC